ncbi:MAG: guanylate kinase [Acetomicrobium flavidum]|uniref:Guanylate kinase n=1 Tax=Acetomicrobium mobile (strain ATCC BAA-54 / DSM 13181 / JCM 12221 / NGA) TaxID=891968 RepID=I4BWC3_ACEMN|nr:guanylate kinase [Acetomicrobium mobile]AFM21580.1 guanylate kinase [Acetomicrobium mobile DSM 13181]NLG94895.1 guanylate kinase [Acetomicrobium flavidum]
MVTKKRGHLFVISGPSGAGKGTIRRELFKRLPDLIYSVSCTTRPPREGEVNGVDYYFIDPEKFAEKQCCGEFLEWAFVHGNYYGTPKDDVLKHLEEGRDVILEIDVQGAINIKKVFPEAVLIFILPPSEEALKQRLISRGTENEESLMIRLNNAALEMKLVDIYDHAIINDDVNRATDELIDIITSYRKGEKKDDLRRCCPNNEEVQHP